MRSGSVAVGTYQFTLCDFFFYPLPTIAIGSTLRNTKLFVGEVVEIHLPRMIRKAAIRTRGFLKLLDFRGDFFKSGFALNFDLSPSCRSIVFVPLFMSKTLTSSAEGLKLFPSFIEF